MDCLVLEELDLENLLHLMHRTYKTRHRQFLLLQNQLLKILNRRNL